MSLGVAGAGRRVSRREKKTKLKLTSKYITKLAVALAQLVQRNTAWFIFESPVTNVNGEREKEKERGRNGRAVEQDERGQDKAGDPFSRRKKKITGKHFNIIISLSLPHTYCSNIF